MLLRLGYQSADSSDAKESIRLLNKTKTWTLKGSFWWVSESVRHWMNSTKKKYTTNFASMYSVKLCRFTKMKLMIQGRNPTFIMWWWVLYAQSHVFLLRIMIFWFQMLLSSLLSSLRNMINVCQSLSALICFSIINIGMNKEFWSVSKNV